MRIYNKIEGLRAGILCMSFLNKFEKDAKKFIKKTYKGLNKL